MSRKNKFDLTGLVHDGLLKNGDETHFVSDLSKTAVVTKQQNGEYKLKCDGKMLTVHAFAQALLGQEPPGHASRWICDRNGKTLYDLWQSTMDEAEAA